MCVFLWILVHVFFCFLFFICHLSMNNVCMNEMIYIYIYIYVVIILHKYYNLFEFIIVVYYNFVRYLIVERKRVRKFTSFL